ncbi:MAG: hypothetical protein BWX70_02814 [Verrucomicrobia bacterium ADurb.Bin070]|nr:MAG: hypothetical protein BWX70_02814 [Verrucomicrobia bacterium ADurb.Bin070]
MAAGGQNRRRGLRQQRIRPIRGRPRAVGLAGHRHITDPQHLDPVRSDRVGAIPQIRHRHRHIREGDIRRDHQLHRLHLIRGQSHRQRLGDLPRQRAVFRNLPARGRAPEIERGMADRQQFAVAVIIEFRHMDGASRREGVTHFDGHLPLADARHLIRDLDVEGAASGKIHGHRIGVGGLARTRKGHARLRVQGCAGRILHAQIHLIGSARQGIAQPPHLHAHARPVNLRFDVSSRPGERDRLALDIAFKAVAVHLQVAGRLHAAQPHPERLGRKKGGGQIDLHRTAVGELPHVFPLFTVFRRIDRQTA